MTTQNMTVAVTAAVTQKKRGRKSLWETDYDAAVKRQWGQVMRAVKKEARKPRKPVPMMCEVVALLNQHGEVVERYGAVIGDVAKVAKKGGRKSLWETDPVAAAARELELQLSKVPKGPKASKASKASKVAKELKKRGRKSLWETDYDAAVKRQWERVMKELPKPPKEGKLKAGVLEKHQKLAKESKQLKAAKKEILELKAELDALKLPKKHSV